MWYVSHARVASALHCVFSDLSYFITTRATSSAGTSSTSYSTSSTRRSTTTSPTHSKSTTLSLDSVLLTADYDSNLYCFLQLRVADPSSSGCRVLPHQLVCRSPQACGNFCRQPNPPYFFSLLGTTTSTYCNIYSLFSFVEINDESNTKSSCFVAYQFHAPEAALSSGAVPCSWSCH
jgi:hypothetical protein